MAGLDMTAKPAEGGDASAGILELNGVIDGTTAGQFQTGLEDAFKRGLRKVVLDMSKVRYVNSTGLGAIVKFNDKLKTAGGGLALAKVTPKVKIVIEMLGLQAFFEIAADEKAALEALARKTGGGGGPPPAAPPSSTPPPFAAAPAPAPYSPPPPPPGGGWGAPPSPPAAPAAPPAIGGAGFPKTLACATCGVQIEVRSPGNWKCPRCGTLAAVKPDGSARFSSPDKPGPYEVSLNVTREGSEALALFVGSLASAAIGPAGDVVRSAVGEVVHVIAASAYNYDPKAMLHVSIETGNGEVRIKLADHGKTLDGSQANAYFPNASRAMNEFECRAHPKGGNVIRMVKRK